jgi:hypothetical protein
MQSVALKEIGDERCGDAIIDGLQRDDISCRHSIQEHGKRVFSLGHEREREGVTGKGARCAIEERFLRYADRRVRRKRTRKKKVGLLRSE